MDRKRQVLKYSLVSFWSALNRVKNKYLFHMRWPTKKPPPKVHGEAIKKDLPVDPLSSSLFGSMDGGMNSKGKGKFSHCILFHLIVA